jgi:hypothetical protein
VVHHAVRVGFWVVACGARHAVSNHVLRLGLPVRQGGGSRTRNRCEGPHRRHDDGYRTRSATVRCRRPRNRSQRPRKPPPCDSGVADERAAHTQVGSVRCDHRPCAGVCQRACAEAAKERAGGCPKRARGRRACGRGRQRACAEAAKTRAVGAAKGRAWRPSKSVRGRLSRAWAGLPSLRGGCQRAVTYD